MVVGDINPLQSDKDIEGKNILYVPLDVTSWASQSSFFKKAYELHGKIDHVFANAGKFKDAVRRVRIERSYKKERC